MLPVQILLLEEMERRQVVRNYNIARRIRRNDSDPFALEDGEFVRLFRLTKDLVNVIIAGLHAHLSNSTHVNSVSPEMRIFAALYFFATGSYQRTVGQSFNLSMSQQTISRCIEQVGSLIVEHFMQDWVKFPTTPGEKAAIKQQFMTNFRFPGCIGCIDCTHVAIIAPKDEEHNYLNRKGFHSKNVQLICDANLKILAVNARYAGATHDAAIWNNSHINDYLNQCFGGGDRNTWLLGDSGYPQLPWLMTPILHPTPGAEELYNQRLSSTRNCIERCNGVLKGRYRCILGERVLRYAPEKVGMIINVCVILHNMCIEARLPNDDIQQDNLQLNVVNNEEQHNQGIIPLAQDGRQARRHLIERYFQ